MFFASLNQPYKSIHAIQFPLKLQLYFKLIIFFLMIHLI